MGSLFSHLDTEIRHKYTVVQNHINVEPCNKVHHYIIQIDQRLYWSLGVQYGEVDTWRSFVTKKSICYQRRTLISSHYQQMKRLRGRLVNAGVNVKISFTLGREEKTCLFHTCATLGAVNQSQFPNQLGGPMQCPLLPARSRSCRRKMYPTKLGRKMPGYFPDSGSSKVCVPTSNKWIRG